MLPRSGGFTALTFASEPMKHEIDQNQCRALNCQRNVSDGPSPARDTRVTSQGLDPGEQGNERENDSGTIRSELCVTVLKHGCYIKPFFIGKKKKKTEKGSIWKTFCNHRNMKVCRWRKISV